MPKGAGKRRSDALAPNDMERILARTARAGGVSVSLFERSGESERQPLVNSGARSAACRHVSRLPWGKQACRRSREKALALSLRLGRPAPFICHMGFACAAHGLSAGESEDEYVLAMGPYCPSETPDSLEKDALDGLRALVSEPVDELPFDLGDIPLVSASVVPELAGWTAESLLAAGDEEVLEETADDDPGTGPRARRRQRNGPYDPYQAADIASALAGGNQDQARDIVRSVMTESIGGKRAPLAMKRARAVSLVGAVLEAGERASLDTSACWPKFGEFDRAVRSAKSVRDLVLGAMKVLGALKRSVAKTSGDAEFYRTLNSLVAQRVTDDVTLNEIAKSLHVHPTAVTHRLQRKFGMSFSEYRGRIRVDLAKPLLRDTKLKVREVALRVGINDTGNFSKLFRKFERMSPLEYRERYAKRR